MTEENKNDNITKDTNNEETKTVENQEEVVVPEKTKK